MCWLRIGKGVLAEEVPTEGQGTPAPHQAPHHRAPVPGSGIPTTTGCENQQGLHLSEMEGCCEPTYQPKGPPTDSTHSHTFTLCSRERTEVQKSPGMYKEERNFLVSGPGLKGQLSPRVKCPQKSLFIIRQERVEGAELGCCGGVKQKRGARVKKVRF